MKENTLRSYLQKLEKENLLKKISVPVDPEYEITEIVDRFYRRSEDPAFSDVPAFYFENVQGSRFPLAINILGSEKGMEILAGKKIEEIGGEIARAWTGFQNRAAQGSILPWLWEEKDFLLKARFIKPKHVKNSPVKEVIKTGPDINLYEFPIMKCWPKDGGKFITAGLVFSKSPKTGQKNVGIYRLQVLNQRELILHWQIQKGGGFHYFESEELNQPLEVAVVIGCDPAIWLAGILPLPEGMDEIAFSSFLSGRPVPLVRCETVNLDVPASAEIVIEGIANPGRKALEGPFGDHFGHYSHPAQFPVLEIKCITNKKNAVYHSALVGKPPQEDKVMGESVTKIFTPIVKLMKPELADLWAYYEAGFHNLLVASVKQRYEKEGIKTALSLLGEGQLSLSKCVILVDEDVNVKDFKAVLRALKENFNPRNDFILIPSTAQDTLDFTGPKINLGSKMILDATGKKKEKKNQPVESMDVSFLKNFDKNILDWRLLEETLLVVRIAKGGEKILERLLVDSRIDGIKWLVLVSEDVPLQNDRLLLWGMFTRFDCERDILFTSSKLEGISPVYEGVLGINSTWKENYPPVVEMDPGVVEKVNARWKEYGFAM